MRIKNFINASREIFERRYRPGKTLLWIWLKRDMWHSRGMKTGVDAACGPMNCRKLFRTDKYIGIDIHKESLDKGIEKYPEAVAVYSKIEDVKGINGDFVVCVQAININQLFKTENTLDVIKSLVSMVNKGGSLIFNAGSKGVSPDKMEQNIDNIIKGKFLKINKKRYGAFYDDQYKTNKIMSIIIAFLMFLIPPLRTTGGKDYKQIYYFCRKRI